MKRRFQPHRRYAVLAAFILLCVAGPAFGEALPESAKKNALHWLLDSIGKDDNYATAVKSCREAEKVVARYDREPVVEGRIADCFADAEKIRNNKQAACRYLLKALNAYKEASPSEKWYNENNVGDTRKAMEKLGC